MSVPGVVLAAQERARKAEALLAEVARSPIAGVSFSGAPEVKIDRFVWQQIEGYGRDAAD